jgi:hypothetical protein
MKTPRELSRDCIRQFGYGVDYRFIEQVQADARKDLIEQIRQATQELETSAAPFDSACVRLRELLK